MAAKPATVAIAFTPAPATQSPNLRRTDDGGAAAAYYRAIVVTFASLRRWNPDFELILVSEAEPPDSFAKELANVNARTQITGFAHRPPDGFWPKFNASLYSIDAMQELTRTLPPAHPVLLVDPDVLCIGDLTKVVQHLAGDTWLAYPLDLPADQKVEGLSTLDAVELHRALDPALSDPPTYYGGEIYGFTPKGADPVLQRAEAAWNYALRTWQHQQPHFVTEEHLLNYALRGVQIVDASGVIRRIWTAPVHRTVEGDERDLLLWHLPAEKDRGYVSLYPAVQDLDSWFWHADRDDFIRRSGRILGIPRRLPPRWMYDTSGAAVRALQRQLTKRVHRSAA